MSLVWAVLAVIALTSTQTPCAIDGGATTVFRLADLPAPFRDGIAQVFRGSYAIAEADGPFDASDVMSSAHPLPQRRFLRAIGRGGRWIIWSEHGGIGDHLHATGFRIVEQNGRLVAGIDVSARYGGSPAQLCHASQAWLGPDPVATATDD